MVDGGAPGCEVAWPAAVWPPLGTAAVGDDAAWGEPGAGDKDCGEAACCRALPAPIAPTPASTGAVAALIDVPAAGAEPPVPGVPVMPAEDMDDLGPTRPPENGDRPPVKGVPGSPIWVEGESGTCPCGPGAPPTWSPTSLWMVNSCADVVAAVATLPERIQVPRNLVIWVTGLTPATVISEPIHPIICMPIMGARRTPR